MKLRPNFQQEWLALHQSYERYEFQSLMIKLLSIVLFFAAITLSINPIMAALLLSVLWLQEAIWKTFQSRTEQRILKIEAELTQPSDAQAFCFYSEWTDNRPTTLGLIKDYVRHALRPTIAYPYLVLIGLTLLSLLF